MLPVAAYPAPFAGGSIFKPQRFCKRTLITVPNAAIETSRQIKMGLPGCPPTWNRHDLFSNACTFVQSDTCAKSIGVFTHYGTGSSGCHFQRIYLCKIRWRNPGESFPPRREEDESFPMKLKSWSVSQATLLRPGFKEGRWPGAWPLKAMRLRPSRPCSPIWLITWPGMPCKARFVWQELMNRTDRASSSPSALMARSPTRMQKHHGMDQPPAVVWIAV